MTPKQEAFVREYLLDLNATAAYRRAGYVAKGNAAEVNAARLLRNAQVASAITEAQQKRSERTEINADWVLKRLHDTATADLSDLYDEIGQLRPMKDWPLIWRTGLVAGIETATERDGEDFVTVRKVKLADRTKLLEMIGRHVAVGAFKELLKIEGDLTISERLRRAEERTK